MGHLSSFNMLDKGISYEENNLIQYVAGGVRNDDGEVRGGTAENSRNTGIDRGANTENTGPAQTGREWGNPTASV